jgi:hypothetical protein
VATCSESGSNPSSCVLGAASPVAPPALGAAGRCDPDGAAAPKGGKQLHLRHGASSYLSQQRIANQKKEDAVEKKDEDWAYDCTTNVISISTRLDSCILRHTYLIGPCGV